MNYNKSFSLLVASMMASSAFTAVVSAKNPYKELAQADMFFHQVEKVGNKYVVSTASNDTIAVNDLRAGEARMFVGEIRSDDIVGQARGADGAAVAEVAAMIARGEALLPRLETAAKAATAELDVADTLTDTTNWIAEVNGKYAGSADGVALIGTMRNVLVALSKVNNTAGANVANSPFAAALAEGFKAENVPNGQKDETTSVNIVKRALCMEVATPDANVHTGICVGDVVNGINDANKYKVVASAVFKSQTANAAANTAELAVGACVPITRTILSNVQAPGGNVQLQCAAGAVVHATNTFIVGRPSNTGGAVADNTVIVGNITVAAQLKNYSGWVENYACYRAKNFLEETEPLVKDKNTVKGVSAAYLGASNGSSSVKITSNTKKGKDAVGITLIKDQSVFVGGTNGSAVTPVIFVFTGNTVSKDTAFSGELSLTVDSGKPKKVEFSGNAVKQTEVTEGFIDNITSVVLPQGFKLTKDMVKEIKTEYKGSQVEFTVALTDGNTAKFVFSNGGNMTEMPLSVEADNDNEAVKKLFESSNNSVSAMKVSLAGTGKYTIVVPASMVGSWAQDLKDGTKVNCYLANGERLDQEAAKAKTAAKASADEDEDAKAVNSNVVTAKKNGDNVEITVDSSKVEVDDNDMLLFTKEELNFDEAKAEEEEKEDADADVEDEEDVEDGEEAQAMGEPEVTSDEVLTGNENGENAAAATAAEAGNVAAETDATNTVPSTGADVSAAALAVASLAAGAVALKKGKK